MISPPLVEREACLGAIRFHVAALAAGTGHTLLVCGEAGVGKTSVLQRVVEEHPGLAVWWGACDALETPHPLAPLRYIARSAHWADQSTLDLVKFIGRRIDGCRRCWR